MKELSIEEKAKAYDEALEKARMVLQERGNEPDGASILSDLFPELAESEDKRIRGAIIDHLKDHNLVEWAAWLEKQGEQKPVWSEEDEKFVHGLIRGLTAKRDIHGHTTFSSDCIDITETIDWLKSFKDRVQPKQEWSDVDKNILSRIIDNLMFIRDTISIDPNYAVNISDTEREITWLKSLRPQTTWKPSKGQLECLGYAIEKAEKDFSSLTNNRVYLTLKALKEQLEKL